jgi:predicted metal-dependent hydrolase
MVKESCRGELHPRAIDGLLLFNERKFFEAHEALEDAWRSEHGPIRELYRGILQAAVVYLHITRHNYAGAIKVYGRSQKWLVPWPDLCRGINVLQLRRDLDEAVAEVRRLGPDRLSAFDVALIKPVAFEHVQN